MKKTCAPARGRTRSIDAEADRPAFLDRPALFVEADRQERRHDHEAGERGKQDVVAPERDERPHEGNRQNEHYRDRRPDWKPDWIQKSRQPADKPAESFEERQVTL